MLNDEQKEYKNLGIKDGPKDGHSTKQRVRVHWIIKRIKSVMSLVCLQGLTLT
jgi:hypothetical protein